MYSPKVELPKLTKLSLFLLLSITSVPEVGISGELGPENPSVQCECVGSYPAAIRYSSSYENDWYMCPDRTSYVRNFDCMIEPGREIQFGGLYAHTVTQTVTRVYDSVTVEGCLAKVSEDNDGFEARGVVSSSPCFVSGLAGECGVLPHPVFYPDVVGRFPWQSCRPIQESL